MNYFWVRVYDYVFQRDENEKGILLDEFYLKENDLTREKAKYKVKDKYNQIVEKELKFSKPRKKDGIYAIVMTSNEFYYDWFYKKIDTICFHCHKPIKGNWREFPRIEYEEKEYSLCSYECKNKLYMNLYYEGEFQEKEKVSDRIVGYIYHMYNRIENKHYVGQTKYLPFFRWQEHIKSGGKGDITHITFNVITEVRCKYNEDGQQLLNNVEAWWIKKYIEEGYDVFNITIPKFTLKDYKTKFDNMVRKVVQGEIV